MCPLHPVVGDHGWLWVTMGDHGWPRSCPGPSSGSALAAAPCSQLPAAPWRGLGNHCLSAMMWMEIRDKMSVPFGGVLNAVSPVHRETLQAWGRGSSPQRREGPRVLCTARAWGCLERELGVCALWCFASEQ